MKKIALLLLAALLACGMIACGGESGGDPAQSSGGGGEPAEEEVGNLGKIEIGGTTLTLGEDVAPMLRALGNWTNYVESDSCAYDGKDKEYTYNGFLLKTYPDGALDRLSAVYLTSDAVTTREGLFIGAPESAIEPALGSSHEGENGSYLYREGRAQLLILTDGGVVTSIQYALEGVE